MSKAKAKKAPKNPTIGEVLDVVPTEAQEEILDAVEKLSPAEVRDMLIRMTRAIHTIHESVYFNHEKFRGMVMREVRQVVGKVETRYPEIGTRLDRNYK